MTTELMKSQIKLSDGSFANIFVEESRKGFYYCLICGARLLPGNNLRVHAIGKKHTGKLSLTPDASKFHQSVAEALNSREYITSKSSKHSFTKCV